MKTNKKKNHSKKLVFASTRGQRLAERFSHLIGSWTFIALQTCFIIIWAALNIYMFWLKWDPYPFIFLNLMLSISAAYAAPIILMSQNRETERDRIRMISDLAATRKAEREIEKVRKILERLERKLDSRQKE